jgi:hypothetical protein
MILFSVSVFSTTLAPPTPGPESSEQRPHTQGPLATVSCRLREPPFMALFAPPRCRGEPPVLACRGSCGSDAAGRSARWVRLPSWVLPPDFRRGARARPCSDGRKACAQSLKPRRGLASGARSRWSFETAS